VAPRSGLAWKNHIDIGAGVVDEDYRGNVGKFLIILQYKSKGVNKGHIR
jgi:dUTP pyrophosphatase